MMLTLSAVISSTFIGCNSASSEGGNGEKEFVFTDTLYQPEYAGRFNILGNSKDSGILLEIKNPWQGAENINKSVLLVDGNPISPNISIDDEVQTIKRNPLRIVCTSSTQVAMLESLGLGDRIVGVSGKKFLSSEYVTKHSDDIVDIGYENQVDYEKLVGARPDLVLLYGVSGPNIMENKLRELKIPYI